MARPVRKHDRWRQTLRWLRREFPVSRPVDLIIARPAEDDYGDCMRRGKRLIIRIDPRLTWTLGLYFLLHEYAHAMTWPAANLENRVPLHPDEWGLAFVRIYRAYYDEGGNERADEY